MAALCHFVPQELPAGKPQRVVLYGDFGVPCGGTHVANLGDIGRIVIRKLKPSGQTIRVSYAVA
jgi:Ser-tRNA(Ala) deacylase AlaX